MKKILDVLERVESWLWKKRLDVALRQSRRADKRSRAWPLFVVIAGLSLVGCGGVERHARTALDVSAHALLATDAIVADVYSTRAHDALDAASSLDDYRARMSHLDATEAALRVTYESLRTAEASLDAAGADGIPGVLACVVIAFAHLQAALVDAHVDVPAGITRALDLVTAIGSGSCGGAR